MNNTLTIVIPDTGAKVSFCNPQHAKKWKLTEKMFPSNTRLKPSNSNPIKIEGQAICDVTFGSNSVPVKRHIIHQIVNQSWQGPLPLLWELLSSVINKVY